MTFRQPCDSAALFSACVYVCMFVVRVCVAFWLYLQFSRTPWCIWLLATAPATAPAAAAVATTVAAAAAAAVICWCFLRPACLQLMRDSSAYSRARAGLKVYAAKTFAT